MADQPLDPVMLYLSNYKHREGGLTAEQALAINWFWRNKVRLGVLAKAFGCSRNTVHYKVRSGSAKSYPPGAANSADVVNDLVEYLGLEEVERRFVTPQMKDMVYAAIRAEHDARATRRAQRRHPGGVG